MKIPVLTFDAFNEIDSFVSATLLNRLSSRGWRAYITGVTDHVTSRNDVVVEAQKSLEFASEADAVIVDSGMKTDEIAEDPAMLACINVDPARQLLVGQCSGALIMSTLGLFSGEPVCTDLITQPCSPGNGYASRTRLFMLSGTWQRPVAAYRVDGRTRNKTMTHEADEFVRRFLLHVLPSRLLKSAPS
jgi:lipid A disaccharide synthetase